jgi:hypothetical protein
MPTNLTETESRDWQCHAKRIAAAWQKGVESIIENSRAAALAIAGVAISSRQLPCATFIEKSQCRRFVMRELPQTRPLAAHIWAKDPDGFYVEPEWVDERLFDVESFAGIIMDPACGIGHIPDAARAAGYQTIAIDLVDRGYEHFDGVADFLCRDRRVANIVCNPPYYICRNFALHALRLAYRKVAMIWLLRRLNAATWLRATPLRAVYLLSPRPSMPPAQVILAGEKPGGGRQDFCWLVWERGYIGAPELHWLCRDGDDHAA